MAELLCGGCCSNMLIPLTASEHRSLEAAGTFFELILNPPEDTEPGWDSDEGGRVIFEQLRVEHALGNTDNVNFWFDVQTLAAQMNNREGLFRMPGRCALLGALNECTDYESRPAICRAFTPGSVACHAVVDSHEYPVASVPVEIKPFVKPAASL